MEAGRITHYFSGISVAVADLRTPLAVGDRILIRGSTTDLEQVVESMQIEHKDVQTAKAGQSIGLKVKDRVRENDIIYKIT
ncbi:translation elongation factor-like protein [Candidatus Bathyarchaeota archaeon]|nr:translation elongation factor-like protein [Candidatus Bathyarchaeota archaeon]NIV44759.1 translation elongation factor-like protein [Candidatus Bathyarchaeota archaeon]